MAKKWKMYLMKGHERVAEINRQKQERFAVIHRQKQVIARLKKRNANLTGKLNRLKEIERERKKTK